MINVAYSERELLARMIQCEAGGEGDVAYDGSESAGGSAQEADGDGNGSGRGDRPENRGSGNSGG